MFTLLSTLLCHTVYSAKVKDKVKVMKVKKEAFMNQSQSAHQNQNQIIKRGFVDTSTAHSNS